MNTSNDTLTGNIFTNQLHPGIISGNLTVGISDHLPFFLIMHTSNQNRLPKNIIFSQETQKIMKKKMFYLITVNRLGRIY